eukprot:m.344601 g.344601  ORF g.344601 m.344601 type:complete len:377 (+) comp24745_c0_seq1:405-1535(+)
MFCPVVALLFALPTMIKADQDEKIYNGGYYPGIHEFDKSVFAVGMGIVALGLIFTIIVMVEMWLFSKLRFQLYRIIYTLMFFNSMTCLLFFVSGVGMMNPKIIEWYFVCPGLVGVSVVSAIQTALLSAVLFIELGILLTATYSLFFAKREINVRVEGFAYVVLCVFTVAFAVPSYFWYSHVSHDLVCGKNVTTAYKNLNGTAEARFTIPVAVLLYLVLFAYFFLFVARKRQQRAWKKEILESEEELDMVRFEVRQRLVASHKSVVREVVEVFERTIIAFITTFLGFILVWIGIVLAKHKEAKTSDLVFAVGLNIFRNLQPFIQAVSYMTASSNRDNFSFFAWKTRVRKVRENRRVTFNRLDETLEYAANITSKDNE